MSDLLVLGIIAVGTYALRASFVAALGPRTLPVSVQHTLDHVKPAMFAALVATAMAGRQLFDPVHVLALVAAAVVAIRGANLFVTLAVGMVALHVLRFAF